MILKVAAWDTKLILKFFKINNTISSVLCIKWIRTSFTLELLHNPDFCDVSCSSLHHPLASSPSPWFGGFGEVRLPTVIHTMPLPPLFLCLTYAWDFLLLFCLVKLYSSFNPRLKYLSVKTSPNFSVNLSYFIFLHLLLIIMPLNFSCSLKNCLGVILHCRCNSTQYSQEAQRMNWLGCETWQRSQANWALSPALVSSGRGPGCASFLTRLASGMGCAWSWVGVRGANNLEKAAWVLAHQRKFPLQGAPLTQTENISSEIHLGANSEGHYPVSCISWLPTGNGLTW